MPVKVNAWSIKTGMHGVRKKKPGLKTLGDAHWKRLHLWSKPSAASFEKIKIIWENTARNNKLGKWFETGEFFLGCVYSAWRLAFKYWEMNSMQGALVKLVYLLQWDSSIDKQDITLHTRYFSNNGGAPKGVDNNSCACCHRTVSLCPKWPVKTDHTYAVSSLNRCAEIR